MAARQVLDEVEENLRQLQIQRNQLRIQLELRDAIEAQAIIEDAIDEFDEFVEALDINQIEPGNDPNDPNDLVDPNNPIDPFFEPK